MEKRILPLVSSIAKLPGFCNRFIAQKTEKPNENYRWVLAILTKEKEMPLPCRFLINNQATEKLGGVEIQPSHR